MRTILFSGLALALTGCTTVDNALSPDGGAVDTPLFSSNQIFFLDETRLPDSLVEPGSARRFERLMPSYEAASAARGCSTEPSRDTEFCNRMVRAPNPVTIIVDRVYIPRNIEQCAINVRDFGRTVSYGISGTVDVAVLLDVDTGENQKETDFIAVWYQRGVPLGEALNFSQLAVYSNDEWDGTSPPYFRLRVVDVTYERNEATRAFLSEIGTNASTISSIVGGPSAAPMTNLAMRAAELVLANSRNRTLVDFTFNAYPPSVSQRTGGEHLTPFLSGRMMLAGRPCAATPTGDWNRRRRNANELLAEQYWGRNFFFDRQTSLVFDEDTASFNQSIETRRLETQRNRTENTSSERAQRRRDPAEFRGSHAYYDIEQHTRRFYNLTELLQRSERMPYLIATVVDVHLGIPNSVAARSSALIENLIVPARTAQSSGTLRQNLMELHDSLLAYEAVEEMKRSPSPETILRVLDSTIIPRWTQSGSTQPEPLAGAAGAETPRPSWTADDRRYLRRELARLAGGHDAELTELEPERMQAWIIGCREHLHTNRTMARLDYRAGEEHTYDYEFRDRMYECGKPLVRAPETPDDTQTTDPLAGG